ncbi:MAG: CapA family protein [Actinomycetota bacterium]|nr:CapA family protein [Actinomycetota bacterium]
MEAPELTLCLAGDTMLGRGVAEVLSRPDRPALFSDEVVEIAASADMFVLNLECCISARGEKWRSTHKPFFFRGPPEAVDVLSDLGVDCVTLANNHALDYGHDALVDTLDLLESAGIEWVGAGRDLTSARRPAVLHAGGLEVAVMGFTDHPRDFAAADETAGVAFADLGLGVPEWILDTIGGAEADITVVTPHWGPNMTARPVPQVEAAARKLVDAGATLVAGHSAHVFHGVRPPVLFDLGDFVDDYAVDPILRNDLGLLWLVTLSPARLRRIEAIPLQLDYCFTKIATGAEAAVIEHRFRTACKEMDVDVTTQDGRLVVGEAV